MNFTQFSDDDNKNYFLSQPHQPFFVLAFVNALFTMLIFMLSYKGIIKLSVSPTDFHSYGFIYLLFTPSFLAFLLTTFPRFSSTPAIEKKTYMQIFNFYYLGSILFLLGSIVSPVLSTMGILLLFTGHVKGMLILKNISIDNSIDNFISVLGFMFLNEFIISSICFFNLNKLNIYPKAQNNH